MEPLSNYFTWKDQVRAQVNEQRGRSEEFPLEAHNTLMQKLYREGAKVEDVVDQLLKNSAE